MNTILSPNFGSAETGLNSVLLKRTSVNTLLCVFIIIFCVFIIIFSTGSLIYCRKNNLTKLCSPVPVLDLFHLYLFFITMDFHLLASYCLSAILFFRAISQAEERIQGEVSVCLSLGFSLSIIQSLMTVILITCFCNTCSQRS